ncbi:MAG: amidohydrolase [Acidobacteria bacterium]|nr:amidohydrolase [Acidobacteriota bacterium]MBI3656524.1 amidohydrolase [Acidobacteriota bacterium]
MIVTGSIAQEFVRGRYADLVFTNGAVWTINPKQPKAQAVAIAGSRILSVGAAAAVQGLIGPATQVIDLKGKALWPGFNDCHLHFMAGGYHLTSVDLRDAHNEEDFAQRIRARAAKQSKGQWILGGDWDHESWPGAQLPSKELIDKYTPETPVFVNRLDGHMRLANSYALRLAQVTKDTPDPLGGLIVRHPRTGEPTGILKDAAIDLVSKIVPTPNEATQMEAARAALAEARRLGVTSIHDMASPEDLVIYQKLHTHRELTCRINAIMPLPEWKRLAAVGIQAGFGGDMIRIGTLKGYADGSLGSTTALFFEPYDDNPKTSGLPNAMMIPEENMRRLIAESDKAGLQVAIHAIGDRANHIILDHFMQVYQANGPRERRFRIEHAQHLHPDDVGAFGRLGVIASMQPYHAVDDGRWAEKRIGHERCRTAYAFRTLLNKKVKLAFGSDWTVAPLNPLLGLYAAVTRRTLDGKNPAGWIPEEKISLAEALEAYTLTPAYASFEEADKGSIEVGKLADLVVLSHDPFALMPDKIPEIRIMYTIFNGKIIYEKK